MDLLMVSMFLETTIVKSGTRRRTQSLDSTSLQVNLHAHMTLLVVAHRDLPQSK